jgi:hypothetical protein
MTLLAMLEVDDEGNSAKWGDHVPTRNTEPHRDRLSQPDIARSGNGRSSFPGALSLQPVAICGKGEQFQPAEQVVGEQEDM